MLSLSLSSVFAFPLKSEAVTCHFALSCVQVLQPLAEPAHKLIDNLNGAQPAPWGDWAMSVILIFALWGASAFLVFYDTGLFWQLVGALYSTLILGIHRRVGHVK